MATPKRHTAPGLIDQARSEPWRFSFFQLVRLMRLHYSRSGRIDPENRPHQDPLRFRSLLSLSFPPSEVSDLRFEDPRRESARGEPLTDIQVTFMGLVGPSGVLPRPYTEMLIERHIDSRDDAAHEFFDLFSHRMTALFYQAWQKYRFYIEYERHGSSNFEKSLRHLQGLTARSLKQLTDRRSLGALKPDHFHWFAGHWCQKPRNHQNLKAMVAHLTQQNAQVQPFVGRWITLAKDQCTRLGQRNSALGTEAIAGHRVRDHQSCFRVAVGPMTENAYRQLLPGQPLHAQLVRMIRLFAGAQLDFEIELILDRHHLPRPCLSQSQGVVLGGLGWLKRGTGPARQDGHGVFKIAYDGATV
ncbi:type VI secretion system protein [Terasakiispira papahanaumokuakeensis]|uniref:Type VI secretion system protein n=1 Tax=Terasakiispira papahanaumokuakeensis TaxID=197479 RepID=A0A1E2V7X8_9GAMM|nr:type VI secretion system baseplate subunit TssG [Terasakiispira papahanaumokuakeensis]ODC03119.1 type VI secretion system protein [Terasakiispira papahanaumokuakeensis]